MDIEKHLEAEHEWRQRNFQLENELISERIKVAKLDRKLMAARAEQEKDTREKWLVFIQQESQKRDEHYQAEIAHWARMEQLAQKNNCEKTT